VYMFDFVVVLCSLHGSMAAVVGWAAWHGSMSAAKKSQFVLFA
jgi:hypothetical protein